MALKSSVGGAATVLDSVDEATKTGSGDVEASGVETSFETAGDGDGDFLAFFLLFLDDFVVGSGTGDADFFSR